jgi:hypothetical protein
VRLPPWRGVLSQIWQAVQWKEQRFAPCWEGVGNEEILRAVSHKSDILILFNYRWSGEHLPLRIKKCFKAHRLIRLLSLTFSVKNRWKLIHGEENPICMLKPTV